MSFFDKLKNGLKKTRDVLLKPVNDLFSSYDKVDDDFYEELCDLLIMADVGAETSDALVNELRQRLKEKKDPRCLDRKAGIPRNPCRKRRRGRNAGYKAGA